DFDPKQIARGLPNGLTIMMSSMWVDRWSETDGELLRAFVDYFDGWPALPTTKALVVCVLIKPTVASPTVDDLRASIDFSLYTRVRGAGRDELTAIPRGDAVNWASHVEVRKFYSWPDYEQDICNDIGGLFEIQAAIPMQDLADKLLAILQKHQAYVYQ